MWRFSSKNLTVFTGTFDNLDRATKCFRLGAVPANIGCDMSADTIFWTNLIDSAHRFSLYRMNLKYMLANNHKMITNISNRNTRVRCCQTLFSINCWLANWSKEVIGEIPFNQQLPQGVFTWTDKPKPDTVFTLATSSAQYTENVSLRCIVKKKLKSTQNDKNMTISILYRLHHCHTSPFLVLQGSVPSGIDKKINFLNF